MGRDGHSVAAVARDFEVGWATVMAALVDYGTRLVEHPDRAAAVSALGVDEAAFLRASPARSTVFATGIVDLHRGQLIDIVPGRSRKVLADWLIARREGWTAAVEVAALDLSAARAQPVSRSAHVPCRCLIHPFHVVRLGLVAVDDGRRRIQQQTYGHRGGADDPLYRIRRVLPWRCTPHRPRVGTSDGRHRRRRRGWPSGCHLGCRSRAARHLPRSSRRRSAAASVRCLALARPRLASPSRSPNR